MFGIWPLAVVKRRRKQLDENMDNNSIAVDVQKGTDHSDTIEKDSIERGIYNTNESMNDNMTHTKTKQLQRLDTSEGNHPLIEKEVSVYKPTELSRYHLTKGAVFIVVAYIHLLYYLPQLEPVEKGLPAYVKIVNYAGLLIFQIAIVYTITTVMLKSKASMYFSAISVLIAVFLLGIGLYGYVVTFCHQENLYDDMCPLFGDYRVGMSFLSIIFALIGAWHFLWHCMCGNVLDGSLSMEDLKDKTIQETDRPE